MVTVIFVILTVIEVIIKILIHYKCCVFSEFTVRDLTAKNLSDSLFSLLPKKRFTKMVLDLSRVVVLNVR